RTASYSISLHDALPISYDDHARMLGVAHAYAATMMQANPGSAAGGIEQSIEKRPIRYGIGTIFHRFSLAVGAGYRACVQMIPARSEEHTSELQSRENLV